MKPEEFWNSTIREITVFIEQMRNKEECKFKDLHYLASLVRIAVVSAFDQTRSVKVPTYDELISKGQELERSNVYNGWEDSKAYMNAVMEVRTRNDN